MAEEKESPISICQVICKRSKESTVFNVCQSELPGEESQSDVSSKPAGDHSQVKYEILTDSSPSNCLLTFPTRCTASSHKVVSQIMTFVHLCLQNTFQPTPTSSHFDRRKLRLMIQLYPSATEQVRFMIQLQRQTAYTMYIDLPVA